MIEYRIVRQNNNGKPFTLWTFDTSEACLCKLYDMIKDTGNRFHKDYYVFNDFFENEFLPSSSVKFKIECRQVGDWKTYSEKPYKKTSEKITKIY